MRRRAFVTLLGGAAVAWPIAARAQQAERVRRIGVLIGGDESDPDRRSWLAELQKALQKLGWTDGRNIRMDLRWAAADRARAAAHAADLVALSPDALFVDNTFVAEALQKATRTVPIVFAHISNPIGSGFVSGLARPGGNMTGFSDSEPSILAKFAEFTKQMAPGVKRVAIVVSARRTATSRLNIEAIVAAASSVGLSPNVLEVESARELEDAIVGFAQEPNGGLILPGDPVTTSHRRLILALAARYNLPVLGGYRHLAADGGLLSYGAKMSEQYQGAAGYIDRILKGEKPADLPVQQPTQYELAINLQTAKALGLAVPQNLLVGADEVIE
jgi:putative ABC transport system substrate-binding protein